MNAKTFVATNVLIYAHDVGFWDALIVAAARKAGAARILSEDLNAGQTIAGVRIENPFSGQLGQER